jgi:uncharacterized protein (DUF302 family)
MVRLLEVSRSRYYAWMDRAPSLAAIRREHIEQEVAFFHDDFDEVYGAPWILVDLRADGEVISRNTVAETMKRLDLAGICPKKWTTTTIIDHADAYPVDGVKRQGDTGALSQGFGVLAEIDVHGTFEPKLGVERANTLGDYLILGACNPALAEQALPAEPDMGLLLPCNVVIRRSPLAHTTTVQAINPQTTVLFSKAPGIQNVADQADERLLAALTALQGENSDTYHPIRR